MYLASLQPVLNELRYVEIIEEKIPPLAEKIKALDPEPLSMNDPELFPATDDGDFINFLCVSTAINFCFNDVLTGQKFIAEVNGKKYKGSVGLDACLLNAWENDRNVLRSQSLKTLQSNDLRRIFTGNMEIPLLKERCEILNHLGRQWNLLGKSFETLFRENNFHAFEYSGSKGIIPTLCEKFPKAYEDVEFWYHLPAVYPLIFRKKAQLLIILYQNRAINSLTLEPIHDIEKIGAICDYNIPRPMVSAGALKYKPELAERIKNEIAIQPHSREEIEIRAASYYIFERVKKILKVDSCVLDAAFWLLGRESKEPQMLVPTTAY